MPSKTSKLLVVDASIVHAAGSIDRVDPKSRHSREFLTAVRRICHRIIMTGAIRAEWRKHASGFSIEWYATMVSLQKVKFEATVIDEDLRDQVNQAAATPEDGTQMIKDVLLIEAALKADRVVASMDDLARAHFVKAAKQIERIRTIVWVNPCQDPEQILEWLKHGAKPRAKYQLFPSRR